MPQTSNGTITITIKGSNSRPPQASGSVSFDDIKLTPGAQKSHIIPQASFKKFANLFSSIGKAELPDGERPFDPNNYFDNGQGLPSNNADSSGKAVFDQSQHRGSHPVVNEAIESRLAKIEQDLNTALGQATTPAARNQVLAAANAKVRNLADAMAAVSVGGVVDADHPEIRAVYNRTDPNAKRLWPDWDTLSDDAKTARIRENLDNLLDGLVSNGTALDIHGNPIPAGQLTSEGETLMKGLREITGNHLGALTSEDGKLVRIVTDDMLKHGLDPAKNDVGKYLATHSDELLEPGTKLAERAAKISTTSALKTVAKFGVKALVGAATIYDDIENAGAVAAFLNGDAHFGNGLDESARFEGGVNYLLNLATKAQQQGVLGPIPIPEEFEAEIANLTGEARRVALEKYVKDHYVLPTGLTFHVTTPNAAYPNGTYSIDDPSTPDVIEDIKVLWRNPPGGGSNSPRSAAMVLQRAPDGTTLVVTDLETGASRAYYDPNKIKEANFETASHDPDPVKREAALARIAADDPRSVAVETVNGLPDPNSVQKAAETIAARVVDGQLIEFDAEIVVSGKDEEYRTVSVVVDGVVHVVRGLVHEIEELLDALAEGPGVLLDDIRNFRKSGQGLISFADVGQILGSQLSNALAIEDPWARIGTATAIGTLLTNIGQSLDFVGSTAVDGTKLGMTQAIDKAFKDFGNDVLQAGTGAVSSYLVGNLLAEIGLKGDTLDAAVAFAGPTIGKIAYNAFTGASWNAGLTTGFFATAAASFLGGKLADKIISFDSVSGQIGAAVGEAVGTIIAVKLFEGSLATGNPYAIAAAAIVIAVSKILGGLIGSLLGPSTSTATISWDGEQQQFLGG